MAQSGGKSLEVQEKKELETREEKTVPARYFVPYTDIYEDGDALTVVIEMAGVNKDNVDINIEGDVLEVEGRIDFSNYAEIEPIYSEYNVGHYSRRFSLSTEIDRDKISAEMKDGVLTLRLPKAEKLKPRKIKIG